MNFIIAILATLVSIISAQIYVHHQQPSHPYTLRGAKHTLSEDVPLAHRAVVANSYREAEYPSELRNDFYKNPKIADSLAKESWFTSKEMPVFEREAEKIPREQVYKIFKNAGFVNRRRR